MCIIENSGKLALPIVTVVFYFSVIAVIRRFFLTGVKVSVLR